MQRQRRRERESERARVKRIKKWNTHIHQPLTNRRHNIDVKLDAVMKVLLHIQIDPMAILSMNMLCSRPSSRRKSHRKDESELEHWSYVHIERSGALKQQMSCYQVKYSSLLTISRGSSLIFQLSIGNSNDNLSIPLIP